MQKLFVLALVVLLVGCTQSDTAPNSTPEATPTPTPTGVSPTGDTPSPSPEATPTPEPTPTPGPYQSVEVGQAMQKGDFEVTIVTAGLYTHTGPLGNEVTDYRIDLRIENTGSSDREYYFNYILMGEGAVYHAEWYSTLYNKGLLAPGESDEGLLLFAISGAEPPFQLQVLPVPLSANDYFDVIGENELDKPVVGVINYADACGSSPLASDYLGPLASQCTGVSSARDWFNYPSWIDEGTVITRLKVKNNAEEPATVLIVNEVPDRFGLDAHDLVYSYEPIFLDDYHPAWLVKLGSNEIWVTHMNYTIYLEQSEVEAMDPPSIVAVKGL